jgi:hypothetical protein
MPAFQARTRFAGGCQRRGAQKYEQRRGGNRSKAIVRARRYPHARRNKFSERHRAKQRHDRCGECQ